MYIRDKRVFEEIENIVHCYVDSSKKLPEMIFNEDYRYTFFDPDCRINESFYDFMQRLSRIEEIIYYCIDQYVRKVSYKDFGFYASTILKKNISKEEYMSLMYNGKEALDLCSILNEYLFLINAGDILIYGDPCGWEVGVIAYKAEYEEAIKESALLAKSTYSRQEYLYLFGIDDIIDDCMHWREGAEEIKERFRSQMHANYGLKSGLWLHPDWS